MIIYAGYYNIMRGSPFPVGKNVYLLNLWQKQERDRLPTGPWESQSITRAALSMPLWQVLISSIAQWIFTSGWLLESKGKPSIFLFSVLRRSLDICSYHPYGAHDYKYFSWSDLPEGYSGTVLLEHRSLQDLLQSLQWSGVPADEPQLKNHSNPSLESTRVNVTLCSPE